MSVRRSYTRTTPDELLDAMHHSGFQFWDETSGTAEPLATGAAFALAEHLTGVRITPELLRDTTFVCGSATPFHRGSIDLAEL
ncbi:DUF6461 domain-containing protein (plasmid) [Streptomyces sp. NBC_01450]|uniref:DUF6461 domain-containing protein n=1 Tax=Streptomyces sp. NBC_01450 TaxID=2903871 RepID=UPI002E3810D0|nr:DUF6461 domain-containing protein [Streptomyces sp. NBC_01450]